MSIKDLKGQDMEPQTIDKLRQQLIQVIHDGLDQLEDFKICTVTHGNNESSIEYVNCDRNINSMQFKILSGEHRVIVRPTLISDSNNHVLRFKFALLEEDGNQEISVLNYNLLRAKVDDDNNLYDTDEQPILLNEDGRRCLIDEDGELQLVDDDITLDIIVNSILRQVRDHQIGDIKFFAREVFPEGDDFSCIDHIDDNIMEFWPKYKDHQWVARKTPLITIDDADEDLKQQWALYVVAIATRTAMLHFMQNLPEWPNFADYIPKRPIDLDARTVKEYLDENNFLISWTVIESACSSLNSGKNIILTGPPGCGKTTFAKYLANEANMKNPLIVTASPSWSTNEVIGRYMPSLGQDQNQGIRFHEGFFLKAIDNWLIIDEINRCNIDACFGELFTVLSGQYAILPFERISDTEDSENPVIKNIMILPYVHGEQGEHISDNEYATYQTGSMFRMIGTMNDADASRLHQLSFAFQRRFNIIRMGFPDPNQMVGIIENGINDNFNEINGAPDRGIFNALLTQQNNLYMWIRAAIQNVLNSLFANGDDLVAERVVGVSQVNEVIKFIFEGLSTSRNDVQLQYYNNDQLKQLVISYVAMGIVMSVFPQLMSKIHDDERLKKSISIIYTAFGYNPFCRIRLNVEDNNQYDVTAQGTISEYLYDELKKLFYHTGISEEIYAIPNPNDNADQ